jgi:hypothetical protein
MGIGALSRTDNTWSIDCSSTNTGSHQKVPSLLWTVRCLVVGASHASGFNAADRVLGKPTTTEYVGWLATYRTERHESEAINSSEGPKEPLHSD